MGSVDDDVIRSLPRGARVKYLRSLRGYTVTQLAEESGLSINTVSNVEHGHHAPRADTLGKLSKALGCSPFVLMED